MDDEESVEGVLAGLTLRDSHFRQVPRYARDDKRRIPQLIPFRGVVTHAQRYNSRIMPLTDKIAAARRVDELLKTILKHGGFRLKYRITVDPPLAEQRDWERPEILVEFVGPDSPLLLERGGELLRSIEFLALEMLRLPGNEHEKVCFDCMNHRGMRLEELRLAAGVAAEKVRKTKMPYEFAPMSSRERRIVHLALRDQADLRTQSEGEGLRRYVVVYPENYKPAVAKTPRKTLP